MQVDFQYAEEHLADLASAVDAGQDVEISRPDKPPLIGSGRGKVGYVEDWDSPATNMEFAQLFNESKLIPDVS